MKTMSDGAAASGSQASAGKMDRRQMVRRLMLGAGAGVALPAVAAAHPMARHLADSGGMEQAYGKAALDPWTAAFLDPHQNETLIVLAERIVPGSTEAHVNRLVDLLVSVDSLQVQREFLGSLAAFETAALRRYSRPFIKLSENEQNQIISAAATEDSEAAAKGDATGMRGHFENLKSWIAGAYFSTEAGMKYLGWNGQYFFTSFPGCQESGGQ